MVEMAMFNVQRAITPKVDKSELQFICSAHHLIVLYICVKFHENISDGISVMERTQMMEVLMDGQTDGWMDPQNFRGYNIKPLQLFVVEHKNGVGGWILLFLFFIPESSS